MCSQCVGVSCTEVVDLSLATHAANTAQSFCVVTSGYPLTWEHLCVLLHFKESLP